MDEVNIVHSITRSTNYTKIPGNWDVLHMFQVFPSDNEYDIPTMGDNGAIPSQLIQWGSRPQMLALSPDDNEAVHFFLDDFRFESLWRNPARNIDAIEKVGQALSPDFSLWLDMPMAMQIWQVYRNRWIGCYWQERGIKVIPTISWSEPYDFCYMGVTPGSIVAISTVGVMKEKGAHTLFRDGFTKMLEVIKPKAILSYGPVSSLGIETDIPITVFPTRWELRKGQCIRS